MPPRRTYSSGRAEELARKIAQEVLRNAGKGLNAARIFITARVREEASTPALPRFVRILRDGTREYWTPTPAVAGAPLRGLSWRFRNSITSYMESPTVAVIGASARSRPTKKHPSGFNYPRFHELPDQAHPGAGKHPTFQPVLKRFRPQMKTIIGHAARGT